MQLKTTPFSVPSRLLMLALLIVLVASSGGNASATAHIFSDSGQALGSSQSNDVTLGDLDGDGDLDAFVSNGTGANEANKVWLNNGIGVFTDTGQSLGSSKSHSVKLGDLDGDTDLDAFVANIGQGNTVWLNDGSGTFTDSGQSLGSSASMHLALGDVDGDLDLDAFCGQSW